jgi:2-polyprenyl-3-methyl-5-hydroxy-6-metoxy-1,4-benzoquinol methylase
MSAAHMPPADRVASQRRLRQGRCLTAAENGSASVRNSVARRYRKTVEPNERTRRGSSFGAAATAYAEHRSDYAEAAVRWALAPAGPAPRVLDLGAGTGKLTAVLLSLGADVTAVEPDPGCWSSSAAP